MTIDPKIAFWIGVVITCATAISGGTISLTHMLPDAWIPAATAWSSAVATLGTAFLTAAHAISAPKSGPLVPDNSARH